MTDINCDRHTQAQSFDQPQPFDNTHLSLDDADQVTHTHTLSIYVPLIAKQTHFTHQLPRTPTSNRIPDDTQR
eukprot:2201237-Rhodomonas_salina.2